MSHLMRWWAIRWHYWMDKTINCALGFHRSCEESTAKCYCRCHIDHLTVVAVEGEATE